MRVILRFGIVAVLVTALGALLTGTATASPRQGPSPETVALRFESKIGDLGDAAFAEQALATLNDNCASLLTRRMCAQTTKS